MNPARCARGQTAQAGPRAAGRRWFSASAALAAVVGFVPVALAGPAESAEAHAATPVAALATGQTAGKRVAPVATECNGVATLHSVEAKGCFQSDPRLGPEQLPTTGPAGSVTAAIAQITAGYDRFGDLTEARFLTTYWSPTGWTYPPDGGFAHGPNKKPIHHSLTLTPGAKAFIDRFGLGIGTYLSPAGTSYAKRALPPQNLDTYPSTPTYRYNYHLYKIVKPFKVDAGPIAPWFGQKGEGLQYITCFSSDFSHPCKNPNVNDLVQQGDLTEQALPAK